MIILFDSNLADHKHSNCAAKSIIYLHLKCDIHFPFLKKFSTTAVNFSLELRYFHNTLWMSIEQLIIIDPIQIMFWTTNIWMWTTKITEFLSSFIVTSICLAHKKAFERGLPRNEAGKLSAITK